MAKQRGGRTVPGKRRAAGLTLLEVMVAAALLGGAVWLVVRFWQAGTKAGEEWAAEQRGPSAQEALPEVVLTMRDALSRHHGSTVRLREGSRDPRDVRVRNVGNDVFCVEAIEAVEMLGCYPLARIDAVEISGGQAGQVTVVLRN